MRRYVLIGVAALLYYSGLVALVRWWTRRMDPSLVILNYHRASGGNLRRHVLYLQKHYYISHVEAALGELYAPRKKGMYSKGQRTRLVLTFDDGYRDNYTHAYPLARDLQVPMTIYLIPGYVDSGDYFWWGEGKRQVSRAQITEVGIDGQRYDLQDQAQREVLAKVIDTRVRYAKSVSEREAFLATTRSLLSVPSTVLEGEESSLPLTWEQVREMDESGWVSFGAHTMHHPILAYLSDATEVRAEIEECRAVLESHLGHPVCSFAYPVGQAQHIGQHARDAVHQAGYDWALTTHYGLNTPKSDPFMLRRIEVDVDQHWLIVAAGAVGLWGIFSRLRWFPFVRRHFTNSK